MKETYDNDDRLRYSSVSILELLCSEYMMYSYILSNIQCATAEITTKYLKATILGSYI